MRVGCAVGAGGCQGQRSTWLGLDCGTLWKHAGSLCIAEPCGSIFVLHHAHRTRRNSVVHSYRASASFRARASRLKRWLTICIVYADEPLMRRNAARLMNWARNGLSVVTFRADRPWRRRSRAHQHALHRRRQATTSASCRVAPEQLRGHFSSAVYDSPSARYRLLIVRCGEDQHDAKEIVSQGSWFPPYKSLT